MRFSKWYYFLLIVQFVVFFRAIVPVTAQEIRATVSVNMDQIPANERDNIATLQQDIQTYLNTQSFTGKEYKNEADKIKWRDEPVEMVVSVFVQNGSQLSGDYSATLLVAAKRPLFGAKASSLTFQYLDKGWAFRYSRGMVPSYMPLRYDSFASILDYYALMAIGFDLDSYYELAGTQAFQKALQVVQTGSSAGDVGFKAVYDQPGQITRFTLVNELLDLRYEPFRKLTAAYYLTGLDYISDKPQEARQTIDQLFVRFADFKDKLPTQSALWVVFFDTKFREFCDIFKGTTIPKLWDKLKYLDPSHTTSYEKARG
jgi:Domain of unknown function (DUF4835)